ncbi:hypothetical protein [Brucella pseudogrignonensis]|jgi:hypothetical protein|uniref:hypothetical protein n=1 Tax=Brucella pseudogrignonensis TaxID=419475 RepID=UPI000B97D57A|nr:hypothetical protein [Brucella pseudogrignonensis]MBO1026699.1 hypothetical protein [Ochrobactrum sp. SD129]
MVLPNHACSHLEDDLLDNSLIDNDLCLMLGRRAEHYSPGRRMQNRIVEATIARLIDSPQQLSEGDPDRVLFAVLHQVAVDLLQMPIPLLGFPEDAAEAAE